MTASLELDFGATPRRLASRSGVLLFVMAIALSAVSMILLQHLDVRQRLAMDESERYARLSHKDVIATVPLDARTAADMKIASTALDNLAVDWEALFTAIESAGSDDLGLLTLVPDPRSGLVRISADASTLEQALAYVSRLAQQPMFRDVTLSSYQTVQRQGADAIEFVVVAVWK